MKTTVSNESSRAVRVGVKVNRVPDVDGRETLRATLPLGALLEKSLDPAQLEAERLALEERYRALIARLEQLRTEMRSGGLLKYWEFGDAIAYFVAENEAGLVFLDKLNEHLERDLGMSSAGLWRCETLRKRFPDPSRLDATRSITDYQRANFDPERLNRSSRRPMRPRRHAS
jgi:hypothetical protein